MSRLKRSIPLLEQGEFSATMITFDVEHHYACVKTHVICAGKTWRYRVISCIHCKEGFYDKGWLE